jgi:hypothetical protein
MRKIIVAMAVLGAAFSVGADEIRLQNGGLLEGVIVSEKDDAVVIRLKSLLVTLDRGDIASVRKDPRKAEAASRARLARWDRCAEVLAPREWDGKTQQVPALVVEVGPLRNVPYMSFRAGNYEFNIYGDPEKPAGLELGIYGPLLKSNEAKKKCVEALSALLGNPKDVEALSGLGLAPGRKEIEGLVIEVTPETAEDAFGGWWVTAYDTQAIEQARATQEELDRITATREEMERQAEAARAEEKALKAEERAAAEKAKADARRKAQEDAQAAAAAAAAAGQPYTEPPHYTDDDDWAVGWGTWKGYRPGYGRTPLPPRPSQPIAKPPRYYSPGYSRPGGSYRAGPRAGGGGRR